MAKILWTPRQRFGPPARANPAMAFDGSRNRVVLFGGMQTSTANVNAPVVPLGDTWEWDGRYWTQMSDIGPSSRYGASLAFDHVRGRLMLFGGNASQMFGTQELGDTWEWDGENWTQLAEDGPARSAYAMASDPVRKRVTLYGGFASTGALKDTWEWDGAGWTQLEDKEPVAWSQSAMAYDSVSKQTVLYGGVSADASTLTWAWDGKLWTQVSEMGPGKLSKHRMVDVGGGILLYGGSRTTGQGANIEIGETWLWDGKHWSQRQDIGPGARSSMGLAFDSKRKQVVMFGGSRERNPLEILADTWETNQIK